MSTHESDKMKNIRAIIFPHSYLPESVKDRILSSFGAITVCQPWYMGSAAGTESNDGHMTIVRPPEEMKPPEDFRQLLSEYRLWMSQNRGCTPLPTGGGEDATWEIRQALRQTGKEVREPVKGQTLQWHLILYLERELEEDRTSADEMLLRVKAERSPLAEALGEANLSQGLFEDLPLSTAHPSIDERHLRQVLAAWFGLFGGTLQDDTILLTLDAHVMDYAIGLFEAEPLRPSRKREDPFLQTAYLPRLPGNSNLREDPVSAGLSGKTLILAECG